MYRDSKPREKIYRPHWESLRPREIKPDFSPFKIDKFNLHQNWWGFLNIDKPIDAYNIWVWARKPYQLWELRRGGNNILFPRNYAQRHIQNLIPMHHYGLVTRLYRGKNEPWVEVWQEAHHVGSRPWQGTQYTTFPIKNLRYSVVKQLSHETNCWVRDRILYEGGALSDQFRKVLEGVNE